MEKNETYFVARLIKKGEFLSSDIFEIACSLRIKLDLSLSLLAIDIQPFPKTVPSFKTATWLFCSSFVSFAISSGFSTMRIFLAMALITAGAILIFDSIVALDPSSGTSNSSPSTKVISVGASLMRLCPAFISSIRRRFIKALAGIERAFSKLLTIVTRPFEEVEGNEAYAEPAPATNMPYRTFCGT